MRRKQVNIIINIKIQKIIDILVLKNTKLVVGLYGWGITGKRMCEECSMS